MSFDDVRRRKEAAEVKRDRIGAEMKVLAEKPNPTDGDVEHGERLLRGFEKAADEVSRLEVEYRQAMLAGVRSGELATERSMADNRRPEPTGFGGQLRDRAMRTVDEATRTAGLSAEAAAVVESLVDSPDQRVREQAADWAVVTGNRAYLGAFQKMASNPSHGHLMWTPEEADAYRAVAEWQSRTYMSNTDANGGYLTVPLNLDPAIHLTSAGSNNPLRQLATVKQITTDTYRGVTSAGVTAEWLATQNTQAADASPTVGNVDIAAIKGGAFIAYSYELAQDGGTAFLQEMTKLLLDGADQLQATAYTTGAGTTEPFGIVTGLIGGTSEINTVGSEAIAAADAYALQNDLGPRFQANASWLMNVSTINTFAQFETTNGALKFPELRDGRLLRKPVYELSNLDGSINAAATANNYVAIYGDIRETFVIVDRIGSGIEFIPNLVGANARPTGTRGAFLWFRTGSKVVNASAARILDVPTTA